MAWGINKLDSFASLFTALAAILLIIVTYYSLEIYNCDNELSALYENRNELQFKQLNVLNDWGRGISGQIRDLIKDNTMDYSYLSNYIYEKIDESASFNSQIYDINTKIEVKNKECNTKSGYNSFFILVAFILQSIVVIYSFVVFSRRRNQ